MGMTGQELLEEYRKRRQGSNVSSDKLTNPSKTASTPITGSQLLDKYYGREEEKPSKDKENPFTFSESGKTGWQKYLDDVEASKQQAAAKDEDKSWWEKFSEFYLESQKYTSDNPVVNQFNATVDLYREDISYMRPQDDWSDAQRDAFGTLYLESPTKAYAYAEEANKKNKQAEEEAKIQKIQDSATDNFWAGAGHTAGAIAAAPFGLADFLDDLAKTAAGRDISADGNVSPFEYSQAVTGGISEHLNDEYGTLDENIPIIGGKGWGDVYGLGTSIAQSAVSAYTLGGAGTLVSYFGQGAAAGVDDALERGASEEQALLYGTALGTFEGVAEMIGIDNLFKIGSSATIKEAFKNVLKQAGAEGLEEMFTSIASEASDRIIMGDKSNFNLRVNELMSQGMSEDEARKKAWLEVAGNVAFDTIGGFVSGGVHAGASTGIQTTVNNAQNKKYFGDQAQAMVDEAVASEDASVKAVGEKYQQKLEGGKKLSGWNITELVETTDAAKVKSAVEAQLTKLGESGDISQLAEVITKQTQGMELSKKEQALIDGSKYGQRIVNTLDRENIKSGEYASGWAESIGTRKLNADVYNKELYDLAEKVSGLREQTEKASVVKNEAEIKGATEAKYEASAEDIDLVKRIATERVGRLEGWTEEVSNAMIKGYAETKLSPDKYVAAWDEAHNLGRAKAATAQLSVMPNSRMLPESVRNIAYVVGAVPGKATKVKNTTKGNFSFDASVTPEMQRKFTKRQKREINAMKVLASALGVNVRMFDSETSGRSENGSYNPDTRTIEIDIHSGAKRDGLILFTAAHEATHHMRVVAKESFNKFADAVFASLGEAGENVQELVEKRINKLRDNGRLEGMTESEAYDLAYEEVVADAAERMLADSDALERLSKELQVKDKTLWGQFKSFIEGLIKKLKAAYAQLSPDSYEGNLVKKAVKDYESILKIWSDAVVEMSQVEEMVTIDTSSESVAPVMLSERTWTESEYVIHRDQMAEKIAKALGVSLQKAKSYIDDINSIAKMIADDRARLDYEASSFGSAFVSNVEYGGSFDYTTLCKKRRIYTGTFSEIQKRLHDVALTPDDILKIRNLMIEEGIEATCGLCYVEGSRANMGKFAKKFIELYKRDNPDAWIPTMADVNTPDGVEQMRINHPEAYERYEYFWNHYGKLKDSDKALFASQQKPKLYEARKEYKGEILEHFKGDSTVAKKNLNGGIRMQSFSDFEIVHLIDTMQVIMDMSTVGLAGQAYTKVPEFAKAFGNTGLKINLSLIAKGVDADGNLIFDDREGMPSKTAFELRDQYSKNVGTIIVTFTDEQLLAAMADPRIDFIIPFHRSQWKKGQYGAMGLPKGTKDYTFMQNEKLIKQTYHEYQGRMVKDKASNYMPNEYWDFSKSGKENAEAYLKMCAENNKRPKFYKLLDYDGNGTYSLKADGSTDGYWKLLIDFKMYDNEGVGSPQMAVTPTFNMDEAKTMLDEYKGGHSKYPVASGVVDKFVSEYNKENKTKYSDRDSSYMDAVNRGDIETAQRMVDEAAKEAGYTTIVYHGTPKTGTEPNPNWEQAVISIHRILLPEAKPLVAESKDFYAFDYLLRYRWGTIKPDMRKKIPSNMLRVARQGHFRNFTSFSADRLGESTKTKDSRDGFFVTESKEFAASFRKTYEYDSLLDEIRTTSNGDGALYKLYLRPDHTTEYRKTSFRGTNRKSVVEIVVKNAEQLKSADPVTYDDNGNVIPLSERFNPENSDIRYQDRESAEDAFSNRALLANALESVVTNEVEKKKLAEYKSRIAMLDSESKKLAKIKGEIKELTFGEGKKNPERLKELRAEATKTANRINFHDKKLLELEATKALKNVIKREKEKAYQRAAKKGREALHRNVEGRHKTEERHAIKALKEKFIKMLANPTDRQYVPASLISAMVDVCQLVDTDTDLYKKDGSINKAQQARNEQKDKLLALRDEYDKIGKNPDPMYSGEFDEEVLDYLDELRKDYAGKSLAEMTLVELKELRLTLRAIAETLSDARKLIGWGEADLVYEAGDAIIAGQREINNKRKGKGESTTKAAIIDHSLSPLRNVKRMAGYDNNSPLVRLFREIELGVRKKNKFAMDAHKSFEALTTGNNAKKYEDAIYKPHGKEYVDKEGRKFRVSKMEMMQAIMSYDRELANSKLNHVSGCGFTFADLDLLNKGKLRDAIDSRNAHSITIGAMIAEEFRRELASDSWAQEYMKTAEQFFDVTAKNAINETTMILKHRIIATGSKYIPYEVNKDFVVREITSENDIQEVISGYGMMKDLKEGATQPLIITGLNNILERHIDQVSNIHGLAVPIRNFNKIWNVKAQDGSTTVQEAIGLNWGHRGKQVMTQAVKDVQGSRISRRSSIERKLKSNIIGSTFLLNGSVVTKQIGSLFSATAKMRWRDPVSMIANLVSTMANHKKIAAEVDKYTASSWMRRQGMSDAELHTLTTEARKKGLTRLISKLPTAINPTKWIAGMDSMVALSLWKYAKEDVAKQTGLTGEELLQAAAEYYDDIIEHTQSMSDALHRPEIQKRDDLLSDTLGMFKTDLYQGAGHLRDALGEYKANKSKENANALAKSVTAIVMSALWGSLMTSLFAMLRYKVDRYRDDEDDELDAKSWLETAGGDLFGDFIGYAIPLFGSEIADILTAVIKGEQVDSFENMSLDAVNDLVNSVAGIANSVRNDEMPSKATFQKLITSIGSALGVPANNVSRLLNAINLHAQDIANGEFFSFESGLSSPNATRLYNAYLEGDADKIEKASRLYKDQDAVDTALKKALRENDARIREAAKALNSGNIRAFSNYIDTIGAEGHFDEEMIESAIRAEAKSFNTKIKNAAEAKKKGDEEEYKKIVRELRKSYKGIYSQDEIVNFIKKAQEGILDTDDEDVDEATSKYSTSDINAAFESGDDKMALEIINDLIDTKVANGKTEKEAKSSLRSSMTSYWKPLYKAAYSKGDNAEMLRIRRILLASGLYGSQGEVVDAVKAWLKN